MKARRQTNFAENPDALLWLGLLERNTKKPASEWLEIEGTDALNLELAVTYRLFEFDNKVMKLNARLIAYEVGMLFSGKSEQEIEGGAQVW